MAAIAESHRASEPAFKQTVAAIAKSARTSEFKDTGELSMADEAEETDWKGARTRGTLERRHRHAHRHAHACALARAHAHAHA